MGGLAIGMSDQAKDWNSMAVVADRSMAGLLGCESDMSPEKRILGRSSSFGCSSRETLRQNPSWTAASSGMDFKYRPWGSIKTGTGERFFVVRLKEGAFVVEEGDSCLYTFITRLWCRLMYLGLWAFVAACGGGVVEGATIFGALIVLGVFGLVAPLPAALFCDDDGATRWSRRMYLEAMIVFGCIGFDIYE